MTRTPGPLAVPPPAGSGSARPTGATTATREVAAGPGAQTDALAVELLVLSARFARLASRETSSTIPRALWRALAQVDELGTLRVSELATADHISQPTATALVQRLVQHGWVDREIDPLDARAVLIRINAAGRAALRENRLAAGAALAPRLQRLDAEQRGSLAAGLAVLREVLAGDRATPSVPRVVPSAAGQPVRPSCQDDA